MKFATWINILALAVLLRPAVAADPSATTPAPTRTDAAVALGVTMAYPGYTFTKLDELDEGAQRIGELGARSIKAWFTKLPEAYPKTAWPKVTNLVDIARTPAFTKLFADDHFDAYILVAFSEGMGHTYWWAKPSAERLAEDERQFFELTKHLLTTYRGTKKTFVLQNWEGDWAIRGNYDAKTPVDPGRFPQMVEWINARQRGVDRARAEIGAGSDVRVLCAAEVNQVRSSLKGETQNVIDEVIPRTNIDLVSYSCYDAQRDPRTLRAALEHIALKLQPKEGMPACRVYIGEYGAGENTSGLSRVQEIVTNVVDVAMDFGCPYVLYWQLYCNEAKVRPVVKNDDTKGMWLIKPDGRKAWTWEYLHGRIAGRATKVGNAISTKAKNLEGMF
jgi:hypothetical protein